MIDSLNITLFSFSTVYFQLTTIGTTQAKDNYKYFPSLYFNEFCSNEGLYTVLNPNQTKNQFFGLLLQITSSAFALLLLVLLFNTKLQLILR